MKEKEYIVQESYSPNYLIIKAKGRDVEVLDAFFENIYITPDGLKVPIDHGIEYARRNGLEITEVEVHNEQD